MHTPETAVRARGESHILTMGGPAAAPRLPDPVRCTTIRHAVGGRRAVVTIDYYRAAARAGLTAAGREVVEVDDDLVAVIHTYDEPLGT